MKRFIVSSLLLLMSGMGLSQIVNPGGGGGSGTVTSFSAGNLSPLFTSSVATATTTPALTFSLSNAAQNSVLAGPASAGAGAPTYQTAPTISAANMTNFPATLPIGVPGTSTGILTLGSSTATGSVSLTPASSASAFTATVPANTGTIAEINFAQSWSALQTFGTNISIGGVTAGGATGTGNVVFATSPTLTTPVLGTATATSLLASGNVDGTAPITVTTGSSATLGGSFKSGYTFNQHATAGTAITYTLPTAAAGLQYCVGNSYNGSAADTGTLKILTSASGQFIIFTDGTLSATGGFVISAGSAADFACVVGVDSTHWFFKPSSGAWTKN